MPRDEAHHPARAGSGGDPRAGAPVGRDRRLLEPAPWDRDRKVEAALRRDGLLVESFPGCLLLDPSALRTQMGEPFRVFSPFWRACLERLEATAPRDAPAIIPVPRHWPHTLSLDELALKPTKNWAGGMETCWRPGEAGAIERLNRFLEEAAYEYPTARDRPDREGTSRLSPHLHLGEISPRRIWFELRREQAGTKVGDGEAANAFSRELIWREFAHHLLFHFPHTPEKPLREEFRAFPWERAGANLRAWQDGRTGYPIVDAGMRELWHTGWMHNCVRMIVASFLVKDSLIPWQAGAAWFWDTLVDADLANNTLGWQWTAGCGADSAPYFRFFNPVAQGEKFDPDGEYVRHWIPELERMPTEWIHHPWAAPASVRARMSVELGKTYPGPLVDHRQARACALAAFQRIKR
jgi:deoxyribodipyrimidine photo-lyase